MMSYFKLKMSSSSSDDEGYGKIKIRPKEGKLTRDTDAFEKMDPYLKFTLGEKEKKTSVHDGGGLTPEWDDTIKFKVHSKDEVLKFEVLD